MMEAVENQLAEAQARSLRDTLGKQAESHCIDEYLSLEWGDPRRPYINRVLAFLCWTEREATFRAA